MCRNNKEMVYQKWHKDKVGEKSWSTWYIQIQTAKTRSTLSADEAELSLLYINGNEGGIDK